MLPPRQHSNVPRGVVSQASFSQRFSAGGAGSVRPMPPKLVEHRFSITPQMAQIPNPVLVKNCRDVNDTLNHLHSGTAYNGPGPSQLNQSRETSMEVDLALVPQQLTPPTTLHCHSCQVFICDSTNHAMHREPAHSENCPL